MRMTARLQGKGQRWGGARVSNGFSLPAPTEGWDTTSPIAEMSPKRALVLDNWFPQATYVELRRGFRLHRNTPTDSPVDTLINYNGVTSSKLFAIAGGDIYDATAQDFTPATPDPNIFGLANSRIQYVNFTGTAGHFAWCCNGADTPFTYDGTVWGTPPAITIVDGSGNPTSYSPEDIVNVNVHKNRIWAVLNNSMDAAYFAVDAIGGQAKLFPLGGIATMGGYIMAMGTWSRDAGDGPDDYAVFITSRGQVLVYAGVDPDTDFQLIGSFNLGAPLGRRCFTKVGSDLAVISIDGVYPLSTAISFDRGAVERIALTAMINRAMNEAARRAQNMFGWELKSYPRGNMAILNVPIVENVTQQQFVMNTLTGAWCRFTGQNANCWELLNDRIFFGGNDGQIYEADVSGADYLSSYTALMKTSFQYYGDRGLKKRWTMCQPLLTTDRSVTPSLGLDTDFGSDGSLSSVAIVPSNYGLWNQMVWNVDSWGGGEVIQNDWQSVTGLGQCASILMRVDILSDPQTALYDEALYDYSVYEAPSPSPITLQINGFNVTAESGEFI